MIPHLAIWWKCASHIQPSAIIHHLTSITTMVYQSILLITLPFTTVRTFCIPVFQSSSSSCIIIMSKSNKSIEVDLLSAFQNVRSHVCIFGATTDAYKNSRFVLPPRDDIDNVINEVINRYDIGYIWDRRGSTGLLSKKKWQILIWQKACI